MFKLQLTFDIILCAIVLRTNVTPINSIKILYWLQLYSRVATHLFPLQRDPP